MANGRTLLADLSDHDLLFELRRSVAAERAATARLIALLTEVDARRLYLGEGCSSLFTYCTHVLHLSEHAAYGRIEAARVARVVPGVLDALLKGDLTLTTIGLLRPHLTPGNCSELLAAVRHKSKREVERLIAELAPKPDVPASVRKLPSRAGTGRRGPLGVVTENAARCSTDSAATPLVATECTENPRDCSEPRAQSVTTESAPAIVKEPDGSQREVPVARPHAPACLSVIAPLAPERYKIQFTASREMHDKLRRAQDLLRHTIPDGDVAAVVDRALTLLVEELERRKLAAVARPRPPQSLTSASRYIPAAVKRIVWARDGGQCTFVGTHGRCTERGFLEFHHVVPFAADGETSADNLTLRCRPHNQFEAEQFFGPLFAREARAGYDAGPHSVQDRAHDSATDFVRSVSTCRELGPEVRLTRFARAS